MLKSTLNDGQRYKSKDTVLGALYTESRDLPRRNCPQFFRGENS